MHCFYFFLQFDSCMMMSVSVITDVMIMLMGMADRVGMCIATMGMRKGVLMRMNMTSDQRIHNH